MSVCDASPRVFVNGVCIRARLQSPRKSSWMKLGFSPCRGRTGAKSPVFIELLAARLKTCPDTNLATVDFMSTIHREEQHAS